MEVASERRPARRRVPPPPHEPVVISSKEAAEFLGGRRPSAPMEGALRRFCINSAAIYPIWHLKHGVLVADEIDLANEQAERWLASSLSASRRAGASSLAPRGYCHYCEAPFDPKRGDSALKLFCDSACAKEHEVEVRRRARR